MKEKLAFYFFFDNYVLLVTIFHVTFLSYMSNVTPKEIHDLPHRFFSLADNSEVPSLGAFLVAISSVEDVPFSQFSQSMSFMLCSFKWLLYVVFNQFGLNILSQAKVASLSLFQSKYR